MQPDEGSLLPSCVRLVNHSRNISAPAHQSHRAAAHPPHLVTSTTDSPPLVASSVCSHAKQARGRFAVTCTFQSCKRIKQQSKTLDDLSCTALIRKSSMLHRHPSKNDNPPKTNTFGVLPCCTRLPTLLCLQTETGTSISREMQC